MRNQLIAAAALLALVAPIRVKTVSVDEACKTFTGKLSAAQKTGDKPKAQVIYTKGSQRIAKKLNGATCPNAKAPAP